jgi:hypothetical protein
MDTMTREHDIDTTPRHHVRRLMTGVLGTTQRDGTLGVVAPADLAPKFGLEVTSPGAFGLWGPPLRTAGTASRGAQCDGSGRRATVAPPSVGPDVCRWQRTVVPAGVR